VHNDRQNISKPAAVRLLTFSRYVVALITKIDSAESVSTTDSRYLASSRCVGMLRYEEFNVRSKTETDR